MRVTLALCFAVVLAFVVGATSGYAVRGLSNASLTAASAPVTSACPSGMHAMVWYSARTWSCVSDHAASAP